MLPPLSGIEPYVVGPHDRPIATPDTESELQVRGGSNRLGHLNQPVLAPVDMQGLTAQHIPERLEIIDQMQRTPSDKIRKFRLREMARAFGEPCIMFPRFISPHYHDRIVSICVTAGFSPEIRHKVRLWQAVVTMLECGLDVDLVPAYWPG